MSPIAAIPRNPASKRAKLFASLILVALFVVPFLHRGALIDHIAPFWRAAGIITGAVVALGLAFVTIGPRDPKRRLRQTMTLLLMPAFGAVIGSYYARAAAEIVAFSRSPVTSSQLDAVVTGESYGRWGMHYANVLPEEGARALRVPIDQDLYSRLDTHAQPERDCLRLFVQTGRNGVRRTTLPNFFDLPLGAARLSPCPAPRTGAAG